MPSFASLLASLLWRSLLLLVVLRLAVQFGVEALMSDATAMDQLRWAPSLLWALMSLITGLLAVAPVALERLLAGGRLRLQERAWRIVGIGTAVYDMAMAVVSYLLAAHGTPAQAMAFRLYGFLPIFLAGVLLLTLAVRRVGRMAAA
ncbi:MAG: hypothetical protein ACOZD0_07950 [Pseudomonadota bacterium]